MDIGARKFDPGTGLFISVDPVLDTNNPQTMNGYTYGADDPVSNTDPSGEMMIDAGNGMVGSAAAIVHAYAQEQREEAAQYNQVASAVENQQLENCGCRMNTMQAIIREYHNPVYVQQRVSQYAATAAYDARLIQEGEIRQREIAQEQNHGCGFLGFGCAAHWVTHNWSHYAVIGGNLLSDVSTFTAAAAGIAAFIPGAQELAGALGTISLATGAAASVAYFSAGDTSAGAGALVGSVVGMLTGGLGKFGGKAVGGVLARAIGDESGQAVKTLVESGGVSLAQESLKAAGTTTGTKIALA